MIFLLQLVDTVKTIVHGVQLRRVEIHVLQPAAHLGSQVFQLNITTIGALCQFVGSWQHVGDGVQGSRCLFQLAHDASVVALQRLLGLIERGLDVLRMGHRFAALLQFLLFAVH